jgi:hypothetical protein
MLTKKDIQILKEVFVTRVEFKEEIANLRAALKNDIITFKDAIVGEIQSMREEIAIVIGYRDKIEDHEDRIERLEINQTKIVM